MSDGTAAGVVTVTHLGSYSSSSEGEEEETMCSRHMLKEAPVCLKSDFFTFPPSPQGYASPAGQMQACPRGTNCHWRQGPRNSRQPN